MSETTPIDPPAATSNLASDPPPAPDLRRPRRWLRGILRGVLRLLLLLLLLPPLALATLLYSERALQLVADIALRHLPIQLELISGRLAGPLTLTGVTLPLADSGALRLEQIQLRWQPLALLDGELLIEQIYINGLQVTLPMSEHASEPPRTSPLSLQLPSLPLRITLQQLTLQRLAIIDPAGGALPPIDRVQIKQLHWWPEAITLDRAEVSSLIAELQLHGELQHQAPQLLQLQFAWQLRPPQLATPLRGSGQISGPLATPELRLQLDGALQAAITASTQWQQQPLAWQAALELQQIDPSRLQQGLPAAQISGRISGGGTLQRFHIDSKLEASLAPFGGWQLAGQLEREAANWHLSALQLKGPQGATISGRGRYRQGSDDPELTLQWQQLRWPLTGPTTDLRSGRGELAISGLPQRYRASLKAALDLPQVAPATVALQLTGDQQQLRLSHLTVDGIGRWQGDATLRWQQGVRWQAALRGEAIDPALLHPDWPGNLALQIQSRGEVIEGKPQIQVALQQLQGVLRDYPVSGRGEASIRGERWQLAALQLQSGSATLSASGTLDRQWDLDWSLHAPEISHLLPEASGQLDGTGRLQGQRLNPHIIATLNGQQLRWRDWQAETLSLQSDIDLAGVTPWQLVATAEQVGSVSGDTALQRLRLTGDGDANDHQIRLQLHHQQATIDLQATGHYRDQRWLAQLHDGVLESRDYGDWQQLQPTTLDLAPAAGVALSPWCWQSHRYGQLCLSADRLTDSPATTLTSAPRQRLQLRGERLRLQPLTAPLLSQREILLSGFANLQLEAQMVAGTLEQIEGSATLDQVELRYDFGDQPLQAALTRANLRLSGNASGSRVNLEGTLSDGGHLNVALALPDWLVPAPLSPQQPLDGDLTIHLDQIGWLALTTTAIADPQGRLDADLRLGGTLADPQLAGMVVLSEGQIALPVAGITLREIVVRVATAAHGSRELELEGSARAGSGTLALDGLFRAPQLNDWRLQVTLTGSDAELVTLPALQLVASPAVTLKLQPGSAEVSGEVAIPEATILLPELPTGSVTPSSDVVVMRDLRAPPQPTTRWQSHTRIAIRLGERVTLSGYGFNGRLGGDLLLQQQRDKPLTATGELNILDGRYKAYGQDLTITSGRLIYSGELLDNPGLDLRAERQIDEVTVGMHLTGTLQQPQINLYANSALEESDILAYLLLGRPLSGASSGEGDLLTQAATSLSISGGDRLAKQIGGELGLDEVAVEATEATDSSAAGTALVLGKQLAPGLYLRYIVGFGESVDQLQIRYQLTEHLLLEAESATTQSGGDLLYTLER